MEYLNKDRSLTLQREQSLRTKLHPQPQHRLISNEPPVPPRQPLLPLLRPPLRNGRAICLRQPSTGLDLPLLRERKRPKMLLVDDVTVRKAEIWLRLPAARVGECGQVFWSCLVRFEVPDESGAGVAHFKADYARHVASDLSVSGGGGEERGSGASGG